MAPMEEILSEVLMFKDDLAQKKCFGVDCQVGLGESTLKLLQALDVESLKSKDLTQLVISCMSCEVVMKSASDSEKVKELTGVVNFGKTVHGLHKKDWPKGLLDKLSKMEKDPISIFVDKGFVHVIM